MGSVTQSMAGGCVCMYKVLFTFIHLDLVVSLFVKCGSLLDAA
jgi:hypothetical protein